MGWWRTSLSVLTLAIKVFASANPSQGDPGLPYNPVLKYQPTFANSLPVQVLLTGIVFTLTCVLLIHLCFTAQYHWPLAPVNFVLQMSGVLSLLVSQTATVRVILSTTMLESQNWPYMLPYLEVDIPPLWDTGGWTTAELAAWSIMNATTSGLIQITHIQFLTLLYPSTLEKRLILCLLGPLAVISAIMQLLPVHSNAHVVYWADAVQNVCNATLSLLFTISLIIWGFFVKRHQAWRTDGGTAAFGAGAMSLALASTALTLAFVNIPIKQQYDWLSGLTWAVVMWQSFMGWWWWVGSGMGIHQSGMEGVEEMLRKEEKRERKRKERETKRAERRERARAVFRGVTDALRPGENEEEVVEGVDNIVDEVTERPTPMTWVTSMSSQRGHSTTRTSPRSTTTRASDIVDSSIGQWFVRWFLFIRQEHRTAAREQAVEHTERMQNAYENGAGWGLGSFAMTRLDRRHPLGREAAAPSANSASDGESDGGVHSVRRQVSRQPEPSMVNWRVASSRPPSASWWGPLQRWRLKDSTAYQ
ncbi:hypothetical protein BDM02DRAFT_281733 [Thelephora ganbajun]|uniref:Uncharacterized protein n=1 Tax=Thelephora ganbajun TaxID=370292 RepID=A0ACB6ZA65_THEGA|nr:hypothetical protein BDM02DRAFT_281733 [Thelephora ganbajun]